MAEVELLLPALPEHVRTARLVVVAVARRAGLADGLVDELRLAVGEACARAVGLHREHAPATRIALTVTDDLTGLTVTVTDAGPPAGPDVADLGADAFQGRPDEDEQQADDRPIGPDVALALLRGLVDEAEVTSNPGAAGTVVRMTWPLPVRLPGGTPSTAAAPA